MQLQINNKKEQRFNIYILGTDKNKIVLYNDNNYDDDDGGGGSDSDDNKNDDIIQHSEI